MKRAPANPWSEEPGWKLGLRSGERRESPYTPGSSPWGFKRLLHTLIMPDVGARYLEQHERKVRIDAYVSIGEAALKSQGENMGKVIEYRIRLARRQTIFHRALKTLMVVTALVYLLTLLKPN